MYLSSVSTYDKIVEIMNETAQKGSMFYDKSRNI